MFFLICVKFLFEFCNSATTKSYRFFWFHPSPQITTARDAAPAALEKQGHLMRGEEENNRVLLVSPAESWLTGQQREEGGLSSNLSVLAKITG